MLIILPPESIVALDLNDKSGNIRSYCGENLPERPFLRKEKTGPEGPAYEIDTRNHTLIVHVNRGHIKCVQKNASTGENESETLVTGTTLVMQPYSTCILEGASAETHLSFIWQI